MLYELILINEIEQRAKIIFLSVWLAERDSFALFCLYLGRDVFAVS